MRPRIVTRRPVVEMDGDEMTRVLWKWIKEKLIFPHVDVQREYYDLGLENRDRTDDAVTVEAARATLRHGVAVKCATITPNAQRVQEYGLKREWKSPNATIRAMLDGTVFRCPILTANIRPVVATWRKPIIVGRHAYGDVYANFEYRAEGPGRADVVFINAQGQEVMRQTIHTFDGPGILQAMHNLDASIVSFARSCFEYALDRRVDIWFGAKDTISKTYDARFRAIFEDIYRTEYRAKLAAAGLHFVYTLIDDTVARIMRSEGGILWACKNYDGDVMSDMVAAAFGSLAMMTSVLVSPTGVMEFEAAHGTVQKHYATYRRGEPTSTNPMALIFAWTGALRRRGQLDATEDVVAFADTLERAAIETIESGIMTGDLARLATPSAVRVCSSEEFLNAISENLNRLWTCAAPIRRSALSG